MAAALATQLRNDGWHLYDEVRARTRDALEGRPRLGGGEAGSQKPPPPAPLVVVSQWPQLEQSRRLGASYQALEATVARVGSAEVQRALLDADLTTLGAAALPNTTNIVQCVTSP
jgi:hypothetical protein